MPASAKRERLGELKRLRWQVDVLRIASQPGGSRWLDSLRERDRWADRWAEKWEQLYADYDRQLDLEDLVRAGRRAWEGSPVRRAFEGVSRVKDTEPPTPEEVQEITERIQGQVNGAAWAQQAWQSYHDLARYTGEHAGQAALDRLGARQTFRWAGPRDYPANLWATRGSKVIQQTAGSHAQSLAEKVVRITDPANPGTVADLAKDLRQSFSNLSKHEAMRIARTESATVWNTTATNAMRLNGVQRVEAIVAHGPSVGVASQPVCDYCTSMAGSGPWGIGEIPSEPPWHPSCRCSLVPMLPKDYLPPREPWTGDIGGFDGGGGAEEVAAKLAPVPPPGPLQGRAATEYFFGVASPEITGEEMEAVGEYSRIWSSRINDVLRGGRRMTDAVEQRVKHVDSWLEKNVLDREVVAYRSVPNPRAAFGDDIPKIVGTSRTDFGYMSTSVDESVARGIQGAADETAILKLNVGRGVPGSYLNKLDLASNPEEKELLLGRGLSVTFTAAEKKGSTWEITANVTRAPAGAKKAERLGPAPETVKPKEPVAPRAAGKEPPLGEVPMRDRDEVSAMLSGQDASDAEKKALMNYGGSYARTWNSALRNGEQIPANERDDVKHLDQLLDRRGADRAFVTYRQIDNAPDVIGVSDLEDAVGKEFTDFGYMSTSINEGYPSHSIGGGAYFEITVPAGAKGAYLPDLIAASKNEDEFLLPRGTTLQITKVTTEKIAGFEKTVIEARVVEKTVPGTGGISTKKLETPPERTAAKRGSGRSPRDKVLPETGVPVTTNAEVNAIVEDGLVAIEKVHDVPQGMTKLKEVERESRKENQIGGYAHLGDQSGRIMIEPTGDHAYDVLTFIHEHGHYLDHQDFDGFGFSSEKSAQLADLRKTLRESPEVAKLSLIKDAKYREYLTDDAEMFARAYTQWVAEKTGDPALLQALKKDAAAQWSHESFKPIAKALDDLFDGAGMNPAKNAASQEAKHAPKPKETPKLSPTQKTVDYMMGKTDEVPDGSVPKAIEKATKQWVDGTGFRDNRTDLSVPSPDDLFRKGLREGLATGKITEKSNPANHGLAFAKAIRAAPEGEAPELWRGVDLGKMRSFKESKGRESGPGSFDEWIKTFTTKGSEFDLGGDGVGVASMTTEKALAEQTAHFRPEDPAIVFRLEKGGTALDIDRFTPQGWHHQAEWVSRDRVRVTAVRQEGAVTYVDLKSIPRDAKQTAVDGKTPAAAKPGKNPTSAKPAAKAERGPVFGDDYEAVDEWLGQTAPGGFGGVFAHGTKRETAEDILEGGVDTTKGTGAFGPGFYMSTENLAREADDWDAAVEVAVRFDKPATIQDWERLGTKGLIQEGYDGIVAPLDGSDEVWAVALKPSAARPVGEVLGKNDGVSSYSFYQEGAEEKRLVSGQPFSITTYHGTDERAAQSILNEGIDTARGGGTYGKGYYTSNDAAGARRQGGNAVLKSEVKLQKAATKDDFDSAQKRAHAEWMEAKGNVEWTEADRAGELLRADGYDGIVIDFHGAKGDQTWVIVLDSKAIPKVERAEDLKPKLPPPGPRPVKVTQVEDIEDGINQTWRAVAGDGAPAELRGRTVLVKPLGGMQDMSEMFEGSIATDSVSQGSKEVAARRIAEEVGVPVPPTYLVDVSVGAGQPEMAVVQKWVEGASSMLDFPGLDGHDPAQRRIALLDAAIGNIDRHEGNVLHVKGEFIPIDHGLSFPYGKFGASSSIFLRAVEEDNALELTEAEVKLLGKMLADKGRISGKLPLEPRDVDAMWDRVQQMHDTRRFIRERDV